ncbi:uncharacterized protein LOC105691534 [Athalia rosae]|uniref:uncharacterized protein LOC105691534 n=1 Tax=Athalia rosae TaxID=37344 RepID=UPI002033492F|nr:uncharacterized protein LOC105691534 [Athalia rosae]
MIVGSILLAFIRSNGETRTTLSEGIERLDYFRSSKVTLKSIQLAVLIFFFLTGKPLPRMIRRGKLSENVMLSEQLFRLNTFDYFGRKNVIDKLEKLFSQQTKIVSFCIEGLGLTRKEGLRLVSSLFESRETVKNLYCWRAFEPAEGPLLVDTGHFSGSGLYRDRVPRKRDWFGAIGSLESLTTLSINYAYLATPSGDLLVALSKLLTHKFFATTTENNCTFSGKKKLLCPPEEIPTVNDPENGIGGHAIPDVSWLEAKIWAPCLKVQFLVSFSFFPVGIPEYEMHRRFLTRNTPLHSFILSTDIDLQFRQPWFLDCTLKMLWSWYSNSLVYLYLQLWHHREILDPDLKKLFPLLPKLKIFEFVGEIRKVETLRTMCCQIRDKDCNVNHLSFQLQDPMGGKKICEEWTKDVDHLIKCFKDAFEEMNVRLEVSLYPC